MAKKATQEEFIQKAIAVHSDRYDYSLVEYKNSHAPVSIICRQHGVFEQAPINHTNYKRGCPVCANIKTTSHTRKSLEHYLPKLREIHGDKYDYSNFKYVNNSTKGEILCDCGNIFMMSMEKHCRRKQGCSVCAKGGYKPDKPCFFYIIRLDEQTIKCGISIDIKTRFVKIKRKNKLEDFSPLYCIYFNRADEAKALEDTIKNLFQRSIVDKSELGDGYTETFNSSDIGEILRVVCQYTDELEATFYAYSELLPA